MGVLNLVLVVLGFMCDWLCLVCVVAVNAVLSGLRCHFWLVCLFVPSECFAFAIVVYRCACFMCCWFAVAFRYFISVNVDMWLVCSLLD